jgi:hypothetical protein
MSIISSVVAIMAIGLSSVALRMITRSMKTGPGLAADDYAILFAAVCTTADTDKAKSKTPPNVRGGPAADSVIKGNGHRHGRVLHHQRAMGRR